MAFVGGKEPIVVQFIGNNADTILRAAELLGAKFLVFQDDYNHADALPIWSVFDVAKQPPPIMGERVMPMACRRFVAETDDAAVMWAVAQRK